MVTENPYDVVPYKCLPVEWTAPERLSLVSLLHGGPRPPAHSFRALELGCGDGANLLPQAYYRRHSEFVGIDGAATQIDRAESARTELGLSNVAFIHASFVDADERLHGQFDYIIAHGVFSWIPDTVRDALLYLCDKRLRHGGLLYLNYNAYPGWKVRGMVREFLLGQTSGVGDLRMRAEAAQQAASRIVLALPDADHPYSSVLANEFRFVCESDISYVAHEYLAADNHPYWRSEFLELALRHGFEFVADADFSYNINTLPEHVVPRLLEEHLIGRSVEDTADLLCYRQLHSPIFTNSPFSRRSLTEQEFANLFVAGCLTPCEPTENGTPMFRHPSDYRIEVRECAVQEAFKRLGALWPRALRVGTLFSDVGRVVDDLRLLHRNGLIELRHSDVFEWGVDPEPLKALESGKGGYHTTPYHTREMTGPADDHVGN